MSNFIRTIILSLALFVVFLVLTFPFSRLAPKARRLIENKLSTMFGIDANCSLDSFELQLPFGVQWAKLICVDDIAGQRILDLGESSLSLLPKRQMLKASVGKGVLTFKANAGFSSPPSHIEADFMDVPLDKLMPLIMSAANHANAQIPKYLKAEGKIEGKIDLPLKDLQKEKGKIAVQFLDLKLPQQSSLDLIGVKDLNFTKAVIKVDLSGGRLKFQDVNFSSQQLSGKVEGEMELSEDLKKSVGNVSLKWKVEKSDAVLSSLFGPVIANTCPNPDNEGFCTKKIQRFTDLNFF
ncbi:MAG: Type secretion system protein GspN [Bacteriovoracaceae bacterium]|nr:Type secretion system protein GspN [Bacteriovoracaceae bacterium]